MPRHSHLPLAAARATTSRPGGQVWANEDSRPPINGFAGAKGTGEVMNPAAIGEAGEDAPHNNMMPYLTMEYMIATGEIGLCLRMKPMIVILTLNLNSSIK